MSMPTPHTATSPDRALALDHGVERVSVNGIELAYEAFGDPADPPILLVMGLGAQMLAWPEEFCEQLAAAGHHVVRFDNRDVGLSTHHDEVPPPRLVRDVLLRRRTPPYRIEDLADDALALLGALGIDRAHVVGASMGGFIAQTMALRQPERLRSLTLIMTSTGSRRVGRARLKVLALLLRAKVAGDREEAIASSIAAFRAIGSAGYTFDEDRHRDLAGRTYDRAYDPAGRLRQMWAIGVQPDRTRALERVEVPTLVVHGLDDPLVGVSGGLAVARAIPTATFVGFPGMGHDLPRALWPELIDHIVTLATAADRAPGPDGPGRRRRLPARWRRRRSRG